jgi:hypothetical protein
MPPENEPNKEPEVRDADDVIRSYYEDTTEGAFRDDGTEPVSSVRGGPRQDAARADLSGGDVDAAADQGDVGPETASGSNPTPDQDIVDDIGRAVGVTYQDNEPLKFGDKMAARDDQRWELDPASSEDYQTRTGDSGSSKEAPPNPAEPTDTAPQEARANTTGGGGRRRAPS